MCKHYVKIRTDAQDGSHPMQNLEELRQVVPLIWLKITN